MRIKFIPIIALAGLMAFSVTGCEQVTEVFDEIVDTPEAAKKAAPSSENGTTVTADTDKKVDKSLAVPFFADSSASKITVSKGTNVVLDGTASSTDGGTITYQWYGNNVSSNGGGTAISGATKPTYTADTSEVGTRYYYVVAKNEHDNSYIMGTGPIREVTVIKDGKFITDELGGIRYLAEDGTYPSDMRVEIGTDTYLFNSDGYMSVGWVDMGGGNVYYFAEDGKLLRNAMTPDGYLVDEKGVRQGDVTPAASETTDQAAEQPAEGAPAEEQPAEGQQVEEAPAEEAPAEEAPVEEAPAEEYTGEEYSE